LAARQNRLTPVPAVAGNLPTRAGSVRLSIVDDPSQNEKHLKTSHRTMPMKNSLFGQVNSLFGAEPGIVRSTLELQHKWTP
jgi:hypothetical protein